jgi:nitroreductase
MRNGYDNLEGTGMLKDLVRKNRSYRRFHQKVAIELDTLRELVDLGRLSASGMNRQPLKYILSSDPERNAQIFPDLGWAAHLKDWPGPIEGERPAAYILILGDQEIHPTAGCDHCIAAQSIMLGASEKGLGGCMIRSIHGEQLREALQIPERYAILLVLALGKPKEAVVIDPVGSDGDTRYWRDDQGVHHVPKRSLDEIIIG